MHTRTSRTATAACGLVLSVTTVAACSAQSAGTPVATTRVSASTAGTTNAVPVPMPTMPESTGGQRSATTEVDGTFRAWSGTHATAVTYDQALVPTGAEVSITVLQKGSSTEISLKVKGLQPSRAYGSHLHKKACGATPADAGSHYQNVPDPVTPSTNPRYANRMNEVWLDFTTDTEGDAHATSVVPFLFSTGAAAPHSLVIHAEHTMTGAGMAGMAGTRLACVNVAGVPSANVSNESYPSESPVER